MFRLHVYDTSRLTGRKHQVSIYRFVLVPVLVDLVVLAVVVVFFFFFFSSFLFTLCFIKTKSEYCRSTEAH